MTTNNEVRSESQPFLTDDELRQRIPVSRRTTHAWRRKGLLPFIQIDRKILYSWAAVEAALLRLERKGGGA